LYLKAAQTSNNGNLHTKLHKDRKKSPKLMSMSFCHEDGRSLSQHNALFCPGEN